MPTCIQAFKQAARMRLPGLVPLFPTALSSMHAFLEARPANLLEIRLVFFFFWRRTWLPPTFNLQQYSK